MSATTRADEAILDLGDLVVMATRQEGRLSRIAFGHGSTAFIDQSPFPVALIRAAPDEMADILEGAGNAGSARGSAEVRINP